MELLREKKWIIPVTNYGVTSREEYGQEKFYSEFFPSSHKIFDRKYYTDISIVDEDGNHQKWHEVNRIAVPFQRMSVTIILAHLLGNKIYLSDATLKDNPSIPFYREYWDEINTEVAVYKILHNILSLGDGALLFYRDNGKLNWMNLSMFDGDEYYMQYDKYRRPEKFFRYYDDKCDVYDNENVVTYQLSDNNGAKDNKAYKMIKSESHGFKSMPVAYHKSIFGAFWTPLQGNIDNIELMLSRISEDNRAKFKSLYHLKTDNPDDVEKSQAGTIDMIVTDKDGDFKLIPPGEISTQFKFEYDTLKEIIFDGLGIVFPKHKSSGDMPTGSMKMMFYPTERVVMELIKEFDSTIDAINNIVKQGFVEDNPIGLEGEGNRTKNIINGNIKASIRMFTPQDEIAMNENVAEMYSKGVISRQTAAEECSISTNNEIERLNKQDSDELAKERAKADVRMPFEL